MRQPSEVKIGDQTLEEILELHHQWQCDHKRGKQADLRGAFLNEVNLFCRNIRGANFGGAILIGADLRNSNFSGSNFSSAVFREAKLNESNFSGANLVRADFRGAILDSAVFAKAHLVEANFRGTDLYKAILQGADLTRADICNANLHLADLRGTNLEGIKHNEKTAFFALQCPEEGSFIAYKRCGDNIVKLLIPENAQRSSATTRKCRASMAYVLAILDENGKPCEYPVVFSDFDNSKYIVGEMYFPDDFDEDRWRECSNGVHFFITMQEAINYGR